MEQWLEGVLCAQELSAREKLALVELYPDVERPVLRSVLSEFGDRPAVMVWVGKLTDCEQVDAGDLQTAYFYV